MMGYVYLYMTTFVFGYYIDIRMQSVTQYFYREKCVMYQIF